MLVQYLSMKTFEEFINAIEEARSDYARDVSNPNLLKSASGNLNVQGNTKVKVKKYRNKKLVTTTSYTLAKDQTAEDLVKSLNDQKTDDTVEYKL